MLGKFALRSQPSNATCFWIAVAAVAQFEPPFEEFFATPQKVDFAKLCAAYGIEHVAVGDWEQLGTHLEHLPANGVQVLEVVTDRKMDAATRKQLFADLAAEL